MEIGENQEKIKKYKQKSYEILCLGSAAWVKRDPSARPQTEIPLKVLQEPPQEALRMPSGCPQGTLRGPSGGPREGL